MHNPNSCCIHTFSRETILTKKYFFPFLFSVRQFSRLSFQLRAKAGEGFIPEVLFEGLANRFKGRKGKKWENGFVRSFASFPFPLRLLILPSHAGMNLFFVFRYFLSFRPFKGKMCACSSESFFSYRRPFHSNQPSIWLNFRFFFVFLPANCGRKKREKRKGRE